MKGCAEVSHGGEQFVHHAVEADHSRRFPCVEVANDRFPNVGPKFLPGIRLGDNGMAQCAGNEAAIRIVFPDLKNNFAHGFRLAVRNVVGKATALQKGDHLTLRARFTRGTIQGPRRGEAAPVSGVRHRVLLIQARSGS